MHAWNNVGENNTRLNDEIFKNEAVRSWMEVPISMSWLSVGALFQFENMIIRMSSLVLSLNIKYE